MTLQAVPLWIPLAQDGITQVQHPGELLRALTRLVASRPGVGRPFGVVGAGGNQGDFAATVVPAAMQLTVAAGSAAVPGRENTLQGSGHYLAFSEASETVSWPTNSSGSSRMDSLILRIADPQYGSIGGNPLGAWWDAVPGSSGSARPDSDFLSAGAKYIPGAWLRVYDILVPNAATQLLQGNVTFKAGYSNSLGFTPYFSTAVPTGLFLGEQGYVIDTGKTSWWNGVNWYSSGIQGTPATTTSNSPTTSGTTDLLDNVLSTYAFTAAAGRRYEVRLTSAFMDGSAVGDWFAIRIRDGGGSAPTTGSTALAASAWHPKQVAGTGGHEPLHISQTVTGLSAGTHTLGVFMQRLTGTGTMTILSQDSTAVGGRELYVVDVS